MTVFVAFPLLIAGILFWLGGPSWLAWILIGFAVAEFQTIVTIRFAKRTNLITMKKGPGWK